MTKQQKIGAIILIGFLLLGIIFKFYNPVVSAIWLLVVILAILGEIGEDRLARFWRFPSNQTQNKYPTIEDIRRKYPKRLTQERLRRQARAKDEAEAKRKQEIIDRNVKQIRAGGGSKLEIAQRLDLLYESLKSEIPKSEARNQVPDTFQPVVKRDISIARLRELTEILHHS